MPTVPRIATRQAAPAEVIDRPPAKVAHSTPEDRPNPRLSVYDDLIAATEHLPAAQRMAARLPAMLSDPAAWGAGEDMHSAVKRHVPAAGEEDAAS